MEFDWGTGEMMALSFHHPHRTEWLRIIQIVQEFLACDDIHDFWIRFSIRTSFAE
jgi:hypothetical protein